MSRRVEVNVYRFNTFKVDSTNTGEDVYGKCRNKGDVADSYRMLGCATECLQMSGLPGRYSDEGRCIDTAGHIASSSCTMAVPVGVCSIPASCRPLGAESK